MRTSHSGRWATSPTKHPRQRCSPLLSRPRERSDEAAEWLATCKQLEGGILEDPDHIALEALIAARRGRLEEAEALLRISLAQGGEVPVPGACDVRLTLAEILVRMGRNEEAREAAEACLRRFESKGIVPLATRAKALVAQTLSPAPGRYELESS